MSSNQNLQIFSNPLPSHSTNLIYPKTHTKKEVGDLSNDINMINAQPHKGQTSLLLDISFTQI